MMDARKHLQILREEWNTCVKCELGVWRKTVNGQFVFGEGEGARGVLFIGEGPGVTEEAEGRPFVGKSGIFLRDVLKKLQLSNFYFTNLVTCRSCSPVMDAAGLPLMRNKYEMRVQDHVPSPSQIEQCRPRLLEEIYIIDPILIVTLGIAATEAMLQHTVAMKNDHGRTQHISIPGASWQPVLTEKRHVWGRKIHGEYTLPVETNEVRYIVLPTWHPAFVLRNLGDRRGTSPLSQFLNDIRLAVRIYENYMNKVLHTEMNPTNVDLTDVTEDAEDKYDN